MNWMMKILSSIIDSSFPPSRNGVGVISVLLILFSCSSEKSTHKESRVGTLPYYSEATFTPHWLSPNSNELKDFHKIPSFSFTNQEGATVTDKTFHDKIFVVDFFFTSCPGICPKMTENMGLIQKAFLEDDEVLLLSHSVTPDADSVTALKNYAIDKGVDSKRWHLVTGERDEIYKLGRQHYFVEEDLGLEKEADEFLHTENFILIDKNKHIRGIYNGLNKGSVYQLVADILTLKEEG